MELPCWDSQEGHGPSSTQALFPRLLKTCPLRHERPCPFPRFRRASPLGPHVPSTSFTHRPSSPSLSAYETRSKPPSVVFILLCPPSLLIHSTPSSQGPGPESAVCTPSGPMLQQPQLPCPQPHSQDQPLLSSPGAQILTTAYADTTLTSSLNIPEQTTSASSLFCYPLWALSFIWPLTGT